MRALRKYVLVTVSSNVSASLSSSTTRGLTGCTCDSQFSVGRGAGLGAGVALGALGAERALLAHEVAARGHAVPAGAAGAGLAGHIGHAAGPVRDGLEDVAVGDDGAVAHVHGPGSLTCSRSGGRVPGGLRRH